MSDRDLATMSNDEVFAVYRDPKAPDDWKAAARAEILRRDKARRHGDAAAAHKAAEPPARVEVVNFDMPFGDMVWLLCKWAVASIPAMVLLLIVGFVAAAFLAALGLGAVTAGGR